DLAIDGQEGINKISSGSYDGIICDIKMPKIDGLEVMEYAKENCPDTPFIVISGHGNIETAMDAVKQGALDYIYKPPDLNRLLITLRNAIDKSSLVTENKNIKKKIIKQTDIIGESAAILDILEMIEKVAPTEARVLITGENGSGKELVARQLHKLSNRNN